MHLRHFSPKNVFWKKKFKRKLCHMNGQHWLFFMLLSVFFSFFSCHFSKEPKQNSKLTKIKFNSSINIGKCFASMILKQQHEREFIVTLMLSSIDIRVVPAIAWYKTGTNGFVCCSCFYLFFALTIIIVELSIPSLFPLCFYYGFANLSLLFAWFSTTITATTTTTKTTNKQQQWRIASSPFYCLYSELVFSLEMFCFTSPVGNCVYAALHRA